ncbi:hypothetical protein Osc7112_6783 (plasmid) [Oscillatoria nigro-viridis PCC 7112]|uniref:Uncharacterized protein n=1 Tax=Phormidium nigroviride PCC 7112 TaxID=179408 RepID=K9VS21_9CYAN|nr:hypothetical protein Osc7112_6783 [Oscillatoria nigro-viridis PCC 7112]
MLSKFRQIFVKSWCAPIATFIFFTSTIVFISTSIQLFFFPGNTFAKIAFGFSLVSSYLMPLNLFSVVIAILLFVLSNLFKFNGSLRDAIGGIGGMVALIGILTIMLSGLLDTSTIYFINDSTQILRFAFFRTLEYSFFSSLYLCSFLSVYRIFYIKENK